MLLFSFSYGFKVAHVFGWTEWWILQRERKLNLWSYRIPAPQDHHGTPTRGSALKPEHILFNLPCLDVDMAIDNRPELLFWSVSSRYSLVLQYCSTKIETAVKFAGFDLLPLFPPFCHFTFLKRTWILWSSCQTQFFFRSFPFILNCSLPAITSLQQITSRLFHSSLTPWVSTPGIRS